MSPNSDPHFSVAAPWRISIHKWMGHTYGRGSMTKLGSWFAVDRADLVAGISVAGLMLPEAVAYAGIAGLPPHRAIFAGIAGCLVYAIFGRSRFAIVSPTSSSAAILAATLAVVPGDATIKAGLATVAVALIDANATW